LRLSATSDRREVLLGWDCSDAEMPVGRVLDVSTYFSNNALRFST
jgi:hypothetical protein